MNNIIGKNGETEDERKTKELKFTWDMNGSIGSYGLNSILQYFNTGVNFEGMLQSLQ